MWRAISGCVFLPAAQSYQEPVWRPPADVYQTSTGWIIKYELAGVRLNDIQVEIRDRCLYVGGVRRDWLIHEGCHYHSLEISYSRFERLIEFPVDLSQATVNTDYQAGMLLVEIEMGGAD